MRLLESMLWMLVCLVIAAIAVTKINQAVSELASMPTAHRFEIIKGQRVSIWPTEHRGEPIRIYICPGQPPQVAIAQQSIRCEAES